VQETTWIKRISDKNSSATTTLVLRTDGTYTKNLDASAKGAFGGVHHGQWRQDGSRIHLSGDGNWPAYTEDLGLFQRAESTSREASLDSGGFQANSFSGDMRKVNTMIELDKRYMVTLGDVQPGRATDALVGELAGIYKGYESLLQEGAPSYPLYSLDDIRKKIAETEDSIARAHDSMNNWELAVRHYEVAAKKFEALGDTEKARRSRAGIGRLKLSSEGGIDAEIKRLLALLETTEAGTLVHASIVIELGELYARASDDFESEKFVKSGLEELKVLGEDPGGAAIAGALQETFDSISSGMANPEATPIEETLKLRYLYCRCYLALAQIYKESDPEEAARYLEMAEEQDGKGINAEFAEEALKTLSKQLGKMAGGE